MEQHPIPQQITSYEFKLIGDMTIKQFGKAAGGIVIGLLIKASPLVFFVKYPLALASVGLGLAMAFVPFRDRPIEKWITGFLRSIYSPTLFIWKKRADPNWLDIDLSKKLINNQNEEEEDRPKKDFKKVEEFLNSIKNTKNNVASWGQGLEMEEVDQPGGEAGKLISVQVEPKKNTVEAGAVLEQVKEEKKVESSTWNTGQGIKGREEGLKATGETVYGDIPMPDRPQLPNMLVGMVTLGGKIVPDAIVDIKDMTGNTVRVLRTNMLGQFKTATPLAPGNYFITVENEGKTSSRVSVEINNQIKEPLKISAEA